MKTALLSIVAALSVSLAYGQSGRMDSTMYAAAYNYIKHDSVGRKYRIIPSRQMIPTLYDEFFMKVYFVAHGYGWGYSYYFIFNEDKSIKKVYKYRIDDYY